MKQIKLKKGKNIVKKLHTIDKTGTGIIKYRTGHNMIRLSYVIILVILLVNCKYSPTFAEREFNLDSPFEEIITYEIDRAFSKVEFILDGYFDGVGMLLLFWKPYPEPEERELYTDGITLDGIIVHRFQQTWYSDEVLVKFIPYKFGEWNLTIKFRVF